MTTKTAFLNHSFLALSKGGNWRHQLTIRFPDDPRNPIAAARLIDLAFQTDDLCEETWKSIEPLFDTQSRRYNDALDSACRAVSFRTNPRTFDDFVQTVLESLAVSA
jgi:hypothetical protein